MEVENLNLYLEFEFSISDSLDPDSRFSKSLSTILWISEAFFYSIISSLFSSCMTLLKGFPMKISSKSRSLNSSMILFLIWELSTIFWISELSLFPNISSIFSSNLTFFKGLLKNILSKSRILNSSSYFNLILVLLLIFLISWVFYFDCYLTCFFIQNKLKINVL